MDITCIVAWDAIWDIDIPRVKASELVRLILGISSGRCSDALCRVTPNRSFPSLKKGCVVTSAASVLLLRPLPHPSTPVNHRIIKIRPQLGKRDFIALLHQRFQDALEPRLPEHDLLDVVTDQHRWTWSLGDPSIDA